MASHILLLLPQKKFFLLKILILSSGFLNSIKDINGAFMARFTLLFESEMSHISLVLSILIMVYDTF